MTGVQTWLFRSKLKGVRAKPKPYGGARPLIMNAGASATGQAFAVKNCDAFFVQASRLSVDETAARVGAIRTDAARHGRAIDVYTVGLVICRRTAKEAQDYFDYAVVENADWAAMDRMMVRRNMSGKTLGLQDYEAKRRAAAVNMGGLPIIGDPDHVAARLADYAKGGIAGVAISLINFLDDAPLFCQEVLPRLARMGLREATP